MSPLLTHWRHCSLALSHRYMLTIKKKLQCIGVHLCLSDQTNLCGLRNTLVTIYLNCRSRPYQYDWIVCTDDWIIIDITCMYLLKLLEVAKTALFSPRIIITSQDFSSNTFNIQRRVTLMHLLVDDWLDMQIVVVTHASLWIINCRRGNRHI